MFRVGLGKYRVSEVYNVQLSILHDMQGIWKYPPHHHIPLIIRRPQVPINGHGEAALHPPSMHQDVLHEILQKELFLWEIL